MWTRTTSYNLTYAACPATLPLLTPHVRMNVTKHNMEMHWVTVKEGDGSKQTILCGRVMGAFFVHGEVEFELGELESLQTIKRCTSWKRAFVLFAQGRRRPRWGPC